MEVNKILKNIKLSRKEREINYWTEQYDLAVINLNISLQINDELIAENKTHINQLKAKYSFYKDLIDLIKAQRDINTLKSNIVSLIISYLEVVYENGNILIEKGNLRSISKKTYNVEKKKILKDLSFILKEAFHFKAIKDLNEHQKDEEKHNSVNIDRPALKPGRNKYSILAFYALKYHVIRKFHKSQNPYLKESKYSSIDQFYKIVSKEEGLNKDSFSNKYKEIQREESLEKYCRSQPKVVKALLNSDNFSKEKYPECFDFLAQFNLKSE